MPTGGQPARVTQPALPAVGPTGTKSGAVQSQDPKAAQAQPKKKLKDVDWSQKGYFDAEGFQAGGVEKPLEQAPKRGRTLIIPAVHEQPQSQAEVEGKGAWGEAESPSTHDAKETRETQKGREAEAKAAAEKRALGGSIMARKTEKLAMQPPPLPGADKPKGTLYELLENAKEPGTLYTEDDEGGGGGDEQEEDPELMEAVEECIQRLFGVRGIHHIGPGTNDAGEKVIVIATTQGFGEESMRRVPSEVRGFKTLVALPFDLLPLKRTSPR